MAGNGKGALRIAFEDLLETFDPTNMFENSAGKISKYLLDNAFGYYIDTAEKIADASKIQGFISIIHSHSTPGQTMSKVLFMFFMAAAIVLTMGNAYLAPFGQQVNYLANREALPGRLTIGDLVNLARKNPNEFAQRKQTLADLGFTEDIFNGINNANKAEIDLGLNIALYWRGEITLNTFTERLKALGLNETRANDIIKAVAVIPNVGDLIRMAVREAFSPDVISKFQYGEAFPGEVLQYTKQQGLSDDWVKRYWYAHWELPSPTMGYEMLHRLRPNRTNTPFTDSDLDLLLRTADYAPYFRERMKAISFNPITRVDLRRLHKLHVLDDNELYEGYLDLGYDVKNARYLTDFTIKNEDANGEVKQDKYKSLSFNVLRNLWEKGIIDDSKLDDFLKKANYDNDEIELIHEYFALDALDTNTSNYKQQYINQMIAYTKDAYAARMITEAAANETLIAAGLQTADIAFILKSADYAADLDLLNFRLKQIHTSYVSGGITRDMMLADLGALGISGVQQNKVIDEMELDIKYRNKRLSETDYRKAALAGIISIDDYKLNLQQLGYIDYDIDILIQIYFTPKESI